MSPALEALPIDALDLSSEEVRSHLRQARLRGQPFFPWPDLAPADWRASLGAIERAVAEVLARTKTAAAGSTVRLETPASARALGIASFTSGTGPLLGHWVESGALTADAETARILRLHLEHGRRRASRLSSELLWVVGLLSVRGVTPTLIKGFHTAHAFFPAPGARPVSDIDLVVDASELERTTRALLDAGFSPGPVLERPYMCAWSPPGGDGVPRSLELTHQDNPWTIDLHVSFERDFGGVHTVAPVPPGVDATEPWAGAGCALRVLSQPYLTAYLAAHASQELKNLTLVRLIELAFVLRRDAASRKLVWSELEALLESQGVAAFVYPALELTARLAPDAVPEDVRARLRRSALPRVRRIVDRLEPGSAQRLEGVSLDESFMWAVGPLDHARRIRRALLPAWAGSLREQLGVQAARARQLFTGRVALRGGEKERE